MSFETDFYHYRKMIDEALDTVDMGWLSMMKQEIFRLAKYGYPLLVCGNGGSAAIAEHLSCDHTKGICVDTNLSPFVIALGSNVSLTTAIANDIGYDEIFAKQIEWYGNNNASLLVISSSGNSPNIINALKVAKKQKMASMALVGFSGGLAKELAEICVHVKSNNYGIVEDCHQIIMHSIAQHIRVENAVDPKTVKL
jgi:D-sedoheptulose 7-phosphate isomerase/D-glycero-D-manno-heptose 1,7-bisphosphate phosphatase